MNLKELQEKYRKLLNDAEEVRKSYEGKTEPMSEEDGKKFDNIMEEADKLMVEIEREQKAQKHKEFDETPATQITQPTTETKDAKGETEMKTFRRYLVSGEKALTEPEMKAMMVGEDESGGYLVPPQQFAAGLIKSVDNEVAIRKLATVNTVINADSLGIISLEGDLDDADWTTELATGDESGDLQLGKRNLRPYPLAKLVKLSRSLIRKAPAAETLVQQRLAYKFAVSEENAFMNGNGASKPLGIFVRSDDGIPAGRDVTAGSATKPTADGLIDTKHYLKQAYWGKARWIMHRNVLKDIRKMKDGEGQYLWQPGISQDLPDRILEIPYILSEYAPSAPSTTEIYATLGDFSYYWIADALSMTVQRLEELYARTNQIGYIGRLECDGMPVLAEAFVRAKLA